MALFKPGDLVTRRPEWDYTPKNVVWEANYVVEAVRLNAGSTLVRLRGKFGWFFETRFLPARTLSMKDFL